MIKFAAIIPARFASSRFPGKPLVDLGGKPMIQRVYERVHAAFDVCCVATDDERIERVVLDFGGQVVMTSNLHNSGTDRCAEAVTKLETQMQTTFDVVINVQGDEPFISTEQLGLIKQCFITQPNTAIATLVKRFGKDEDIFNPNSPKVVVSAQNEALYFSRSVIPYLRNVPETEWQKQYPYYKHIGLYAYRTEVLRKLTTLPQRKLEKAESLEQLRWLENGYRIQVAETQTESYAIDTPEDLERLKKLGLF